MTAPDPLVPADVDLRDFGFMPLHVQRLRDSELTDLSTGDEFKAAVLLWAYSWHQQPAGSLPNEERILAARSGAAENWPKVRAMALRGFVLCSDGRLYHPIIAEAALDAWARRDAFQERQQNRETRQQRWRAELARICDLLRNAGVAPPQRATKAQLQALCERHGISLTVSGETLRDAKASHNVDARETVRDAGEIARTGTGTGTGTGTVNTNTVVPSQAPEPSQGALLPPESGPAQSTAPPPPPPDFTGINVREIPKAAIVKLAKGFELPEDWGIDAERLGFKSTEVVREAEKFRQYFVAGKGANTRRTIRGWRQSWSTWLSNASKETRR